MSDRAEKAKKYFLSGYNCAQSVLMAFKDMTDLTEQQIMAVSAPFGGGMGRMREVCGTVSGMFMAAGLILGKDTDTPQGKSAMYEKVKDLAAEFKQRNGSIICRELLAGVQTPEGIKKKKPCPDLCYESAEILEEYLNKK